MGYKSGYMYWIRLFTGKLFIWHILNILSSSRVGWLVLNAAYE